MYKFTKTHGHYNIKPLEHTQMSINGKQVKKITGWPYMKLLPDCKRNEISFYVMLWKRYSRDIK